MEYLNWKQTTQIGSACPTTPVPRRGEIRWANSSRSRHAQMADCRPPVNDLLTIAA